MNSVIKERATPGFDPRRNAGMESTSGFSGLHPRLYEAAFRKAQQHSTSTPTTPTHPNSTPVGNVISERERERFRTTRMQFLEANSVVSGPPGSTSNSRSSSPNSTTTPQGQYTGPGIWCENCNTRLVKLKRQALRLMLPTILNGTLTGNKEHEISATLHDKLQVPDSSQKWADNRCEVCATHLSQLKQEAVAMVQSLERAQSSGDTSSLSNIPALIGSCNLASLQRCLYMYHSHDKSSGHSRQRQAKGVFNNPSSVTSPLPVPAMQLAAQAQQYLEGDNTVQASPGWSNQQPSALISHYQVPHSTVGSSKSSVASSEISQSRSLTQYGLSKSPPMSSNASTASSTSAAASFFARAAQKLNLTSKKKKKQSYLSSEPSNPEPPIFPTNFSDIILKNPPGAPPCLLKGGRSVNPGMGKVKVMLRVCPSPHQYEGGSFLSIDPRKKQVTIYDPTFLNNGYVTPAHRRAGIVAPKMFAFDAIFSQDASQAEICAGSIADIVQSVVNGADGCLFCYGHARLGKTYTMIGKDDSPQNLGIIPCAISWLFKVINDRKERSGARFSVRVSAVEVVGKSENLKDLLAEQAMGSANGVGTAPGIYLREDPICGVQLHNQSELRAPTPEKAAFYLDAALAARSQRTSDGDPEEEAKNSHMLFTLHIYQYRVEKAGKGGVAGGRSRLHLIDLGSCEKLGKTNSSGSGLSLSALGNVILALVNGAKHVPYKDSKVTQLLRESLGNLSCRTTMIAHVSGAMNFHSETLSTVQLASRIHRMRKKKSRYSSTSSSGGESSCDEGRVRHPRIRALHPRNPPPGTVPENAPITNALAFSDPEYISSSEQSCDTVIYCGPDGSALSDRDLTDNEGVPEVVPIIRSSVSKPPAFKSNMRQTYSPEVRRKNSRGSDGESGKKTLTSRSAENSPEIRRKNKSVQNAEFICEFGPETARKLDANIVTERRVLCEFGPATARKADEIVSENSSVVIHQFGPAIARQKDTPNATEAKSKTLLCEFGPDISRHSDSETNRKTDIVRTSDNDCKQDQEVPDNQVNTSRSRNTDKKLSGIPTPVQSNLPIPKTRDSNNSTSPERSQSPSQTKSLTRTKSVPSNKLTAEKQSFLPTPNKAPTKQKKTPPPPPPRMQYKPTPIKTKTSVQNEKLHTLTVQAERTDPQGEKAEALCKELPNSTSKLSDKTPSSSPWRRIPLDGVQEPQSGQSVLKTDKLEERTEPIGMSTFNEETVVRGNDKVSDCYFVPIPRSEAQERCQSFDPCISDQPEDDCRNDFDILDHQPAPRRFQGDSTLSLEVNAPDKQADNLDDYDINDEEIEQCMMKQAEAIREMALNDFLPTLNPGYSMEIVGAANDPEDQLQSPSETPMVDLLAKTLDQMMASAHITGFSSSELPLSADDEVADMVGDSFEHPMQSASQYDDEDDMESVSVDTSLIPDEPSTSMYLSVDMFKRQLWDRCIQESKYDDDDDNDDKLDDLDDSGSEDHPLRPLSMLSVDSDNTFTTNSRPASYMTRSIEKSHSSIHEHNFRLQLEQKAWERIQKPVSVAKKGTVSNVPANKIDSVTAESKGSGEPVWQRRQSYAVDEPEQVQSTPTNFEHVDLNEQLMKAQSPTDSNKTCNTTNSGIPTLRSLISKGTNVNATGAYVKDNCIPGSFKFVSPPTSPSKSPSKKLSPTRTLQVSEIPVLSSQSMAEPIYSGDEMWSPKHSPRHKMYQPMPDLLLSSPKRDPSPSKLEPIQFTIDEKANQAPSWRKETRLWHAEGKSDPDISDIAEMKGNLENEFVAPLPITIVGMAPTTTTKYSPVMSDSEEPPSWLSRQPDGACDPPEAIREHKSTICNGKPSHHVFKRKELNGKPDGYASDSCCRANRHSPTKTLSPAYSVCSCCSNKEDINGNIQRSHASNSSSRSDNSKLPNSQRKHSSAKASLTSKTSKPVVPPKPAKPNVPPKPKSSAKPRNHTKQDTGNATQTLADVIRNRSPPRRHNLETASLRSASSASSRSSSKLPIRSSSTTAVNLLSNNTGSSKSKNSKLPLPSAKLTKNSSTTSSKSSMQSFRTVASSKVSQTIKPSQATGKSMQSTSSIRSTSKNSTVAKSTSGSSKIPPSGSRSSNSLSSSSKAVSKSAPSLAKSSSAKSQQFNSKTLKSSTEQCSSKTIRHTDSDSGNDSGIAGAESTPTKNKARFLSPYSTVTKPRMASRCSSGHGSDNSSTISETIGFLGSKMASPCTGGTSSGYESMLRDSEATASTSSTHDSLSESSAGRVKGVKMLKKKLSQGSRSRRSGPPRPSDSPSAVRKSSPGRWVDLRPKSPNEAVELKVYEVDDMEKVNRIRSEEGEKSSGMSSDDDDDDDDDDVDDIDDVDDEYYDDDDDEGNDTIDEIRCEEESMAYFSAKLAALEKRQECVATLKIKQQQLKEELASTKAKLMMDSSEWNFNVNVLEEMDPDNPNYVDALEMENEQLAKRLAVCKSHVMMVTCFDASQH